MKKVVQICENCGSSDITLTRANCKWNIDLQEWVMYSTFTDDYYNDSSEYECHNCFSDEDTCATKDVEE